MEVPKVVIVHGHGPNGGELLNVPYILKSDYDALVEKAVEIINRLQDVQNGCPLATYQKAFDVANEMADKFIAEHKNKGEGK